MAVPPLRTGAAMLAVGGLAAHIVPAGTWLPRVRRRLFPALAGLGSGSHVALTFDDGPDPVSTPLFLDALDRLGVLATFFLLGEHVEANEQLVRETAVRGHELAVHGWSHDRPWRPCDPREFRGLRRAKAVVEAATGVPVRWYRPPYGILTGARLAAASRSGMRPVLWSAWGRDWTRDATADSVLGTLRPDLGSGATVLLHDSDRVASPGCWLATLAALPRLVASCRDAGLDLGPLRDHDVAATRAL